MICTISYRLPRAELVVSGTVRRSRDTILDECPLAEQPAALVSHAFMLRHVASDDEYVLALPHGWLRTFKGSFSLTPDRRLASAATESTGQAGMILRAAATVAGAALGLRAAKIGAGVALASPKAGGAKPQDPVGTKYGQDHPKARARWQRISGLLEKVQEAQLAVADKMLTDAAAPATLRTRWDLLQRIRQSLESDLGVLEALFTAWRAGTIETVDESFEFTAPLTAAGNPGKACTTASPEAPKSLNDLWQRYGVGVAVTWGTGRSDKRIPVTATTSRVATRIPDLVTLSIIEHQQGVPVVTASSDHLVMDERSKIEYFTLRKSLFGRRSLALTFSDDGIVIGVAVEGSGSLAEAASAAGQMPAAVAGGMGSLNTAVSGLSAARGAAREAELAQVKQQVELEQERITDAGLHATAADAARLQRLRQAKAILDTQTAIGKADPRLLSLLGAGSNRDWPTAPSDPPVPW